MDINSQEVGRKTLVSLVTQGLQIIPFQGVALSDGDIIVPTLDRGLLRVKQNLEVVTLADVSGYGVPFGIAENNGSFLVTISALEAGDRLLRITKSGFFFTIAQLSQVCGSFGGPFGVAASDDFIVVGTASDVASSQGHLIRLERNGSISTLADMAGFGIPFAVTTSNNGFIVGCSSGDLLRVGWDGEVTPIVNLVSAGKGIPFDVVEVDNLLIVTSNTGNLLQVNLDGTVSTIIDLGARGLGIGSGVAVWNKTYIVTTNTGNLLRIETKEAENSGYPL